MFSINCAENHSSQNLLVFVYRIRFEVELIVLSIAICKCLTNSDEIAKKCLSILWLKKNEYLVCFRLCLDSITVIQIVLCRNQTHNNSQCTNYDVKLALDMF